MIVLSIPFIIFIASGIFYILARLMFKMCGYLFADKDDRYVRRRIPRIFRDNALAFTVMVFIAVLILALFVGTAGAMKFIYVAYIAR